MGLLGVKLKGATLIEALVAIIVVAISFVMSTMIFINVISSDNSFQKLKATSMIRDMVIDTYSKNDFMDTTLVSDSITVTRSTTKYPDAPRGVILSVKAFGPNKRVLGSYNELILR